MEARRTLRLATRKSKLAQQQAKLIKKKLESHQYKVRLVTVETTGDQIQDELIHRLGKIGAFVHELNKQVLNGDLDCAIHSMKDMPTEQPEELTTAAVPERGQPGDLLITPDGSTLKELPNGATIGTSSLRRRAQLLSERSDLRIKPLRGNVDTRLEKLLAPTLQSKYQKRCLADKEKKCNTDNGAFEPKFDQTVNEWFDGLSELEKQALRREIEIEYDAIVLAQAGIERSGLNYCVDTQELPISKFVPAPGQGALAITAADGEIARGIQSTIDHPRSRIETTVERTVLASLGGDVLLQLGSMQPPEMNPYTPP